ncbi:hypothetical protein [Ramlibacter rhizophilus]|uniref:Uncharacterized protein n=1 Tax=Ramlibacter rhizophilus TaxID=1781167 RepID=A0A4Z0BNA6_9BURK|nr:hypothetical protein [Ramlibacter rhizophilus]TFY99913.1 hypothetical protein EZ242_12320 [Ramlibacter rhizophilus]
MMAASRQEARDSAFRRSGYGDRQRPHRLDRHKRDWREEGLAMILLAPAASFGFTYLLTKGVIDAVNKGDFTYLMLWGMEALIAAKLLWPGFLDEVI